MVEVWRVKTGWRFALEKVEAEKVTDKSVFIGGSRSARRSDGVNYFDDFEAAKVFAKNWLSQHLGFHKNKASELEDELKRVTTLTEQTVPVSTFRY